MVKSLKPWSEPLRRWQQDAFNTFLEFDGENFLAAATPGAGKTLFALRVAHHLLSSGQVARIVVVVPTDNLRRQWADKASEQAGIELDPEWKNSEFSETQDFHGVVITYQQVGFKPKASRLHCEAHPTFVILDEPHHMGERNTWGRAIQIAFDPAKKRLGISGTLFRMDNLPIPYVQYDEDGQSIPDFNYGYADALADNVCRQVFFPSYEGTLEWFSNGEIIKAAFRDKLNGEESAHRLKTALDPKGDWIREVIQDADQKLTEIRECGHPTAGGLIIAMDQSHATEVAEQVKKVTRQFPTLAISDDPDASDKIDEFKRGRSRWIVAVRMVSEGVDIPRLRVGIYATNILTELFFRQAVGRFVRMQSDLEEQSAHFYIPHEESLVAFAEKIKEERDHQLREEREKAIKGELDGISQLGLFYKAISSVAHPDDVIYDEIRYSQDELKTAQIIKARASLPSAIDDVMIAKILRVSSELGINAYQPSRVESATMNTVTRPLYDEKRRKRDLINKMVNKLHYSNEQKLHQKDIHNMLIRIDGTPLSQATPEQLDSRIELLSKWLDEGLPNA